MLEIFFLVVGILLVISVGIVLAMAYFCRDEDEKKEENKQFGKSTQALDMEPDDDSHF